MASIPENSPLTIPVGKPFRAATGISRATQYQLIAAGEIESALTGPGPRGRRVILVDSWLRYLRRQQEKEAAKKIGTPSPNKRAHRHQLALPAPEAERSQPTQPGRATKPPARQSRRRRTSGAG